MMICFESQNEIKTALPENWSGKLITSRECQDKLFAIKYKPCRHQQKPTMENMFRVRKAQLLPEYDSLKHLVEGCNDFFDKKIIAMRDNLSQQAVTQEPRL